eukprot:CAMPEP_0197530672 /NCGR_PEP_ID=MMETSP1318-20131121/32601_1 /TAXON_ID=552666 /ORGANISM="Partenskyella glossopodia, Strain RCC365" /LENGTH=181 /DNA_ID=CAMNT_0043086597 /DNA_START=86 /DNA_END=631 /DNA_ORIENTATION=-
MAYPICLPDIVVEDVAPVIEEPLSVKIRKELATYVPLLRAAWEEFKQTLLSVEKSMSKRIQSELAENGTLSDDLIMDIQSIRKKVYEVLRYLEDSGTYIKSLSVGAEIPKEFERKSNDEKENQSQEKNAKSYRWNTKSKNNGNAASQTTSHMELQATKRRKRERLDDVHRARTTFVMHRIG